MKHRVDMQKLVNTRNKCRQKLQWHMHNL